MKQATYDDVLNAPDNKVAEILDGELFLSPRPAPRHALATSRLLSFLGDPFDQGRGGPGGWWILVEPELHFGKHVVVPDIAGWRRERMPSVPDVAWLALAPDWICEVLSPSTARIDRARKLRIYAEAGVAHAWLVDPIQRTIEVFQLPRRGLGHRPGRCRRGSRPPRAVRGGAARAGTALARSRNRLSSRVVSGSERRSDSAASR